MCFALIGFLLATSQRAQAQTREAYVAQSEDKSTLTFYYDALRSTCTGKSWGIEETKREGNNTFPAWAGRYQQKDIVRVVFDASFRDFRPTTTARWFNNYRALKQIEGLEYLNTQNVTNMNGMFLLCSGLTSLDVSHFNTQNVTSMGGMFQGCSGLTSLDVSHFNTQNVTDMGAMFDRCSGLTSLNVSYFNTQNVTNMSGMFDRCSGLPSLDLSHFNTQNVTDMGAMFDRCSGLTSLNVSYFNTQKVTNMGGMFSACSGLTSLDVSNFDTQNVTNMDRVFFGCSGLPSLDVSHFNTQKVTNMSYMFRGCSGLTSLDVSHFNTQKVTNMSYMFSGCKALTTIKCHEVWQCLQSEEMFAGCTQLKGAVAYDANKTDDRMANPETGYFTRSNDGSVEAYVVQSADKTTLTFYYDDQRATRAGKSWGIEETKKEGGATFPAWAGTWAVADSTTTRVVFDASFRDFRPTTTARWFNNYRALKQIEGVEYLNTQNVTKMYEMFNGCSGLTSLDLSHFDTQNVTNMSGMFRGCSGLTSLDLSHFDTQNVTNMSGMFRGCSGLTSLDLSHFNTQNVTNMNGMFQGCSGLTSLDLKNFNTQKVTDMDYMFSGCSGLTSLDVKNFNTQNVTNMNGMFQGCSGLTSLDVKNFNTQKVTDMDYMFSGCSGLTSLDVKNFNTQNVENMIRMFSGCSALNTIKCQEAWECSRSEDMFVGCTKLKGAVAYDKYKTDAKMANPETGYFTRSNDGGVEAYVAQSADKTTLTFYYDDQRATRTGTTWGIEETKKEGDVAFPAWAGTYQVAESTTTRVVFDASFRDFHPTTTALWFNNYHALKQIEGLEYLNTQNVTDMNGMFFGCSGLTSLDLSYFNTQNVTDMNGMFFGCSGLTSLDLSHFNTQNVTDMNGMFFGCSGLTSLDLSYFNTQNVTDMSAMFSACSGLTSLDLSHLNTQNVTDMSGMFYGCSALTTIRGNTAWQCPQSEEMFAGCRLLKGAVPYDENKTDAKMANPETGYFTRSNDGGVEAYVAQSADKTTLTFFYDDQRATRTGTTWGIEEMKKDGYDTFPAWAGTYQVADSLTARVVFDASFRDFRPTTTARWFNNYRALKQVEGVEYLNTQNVTDMSRMFQYCSGLTSLDLSHFNTQNVTYMGEMFRGCSGLTSLDVKNFNTQNVTDMRLMFQGCSGLPSLDVSNFNTQNVTSMGGMFQGCSGLTSLDLSHFDTQNVTDMGWMFEGCSGLTSLDVSHFNTQNVTSMGGMFQGCSGLTSLDLSHFNTQNVTSMRGMFQGCSGFTSLDLSHLNTQNVTDMSVMFAGSSGLISLDLSRLNTQNVTDMRYMFYGCSALTTISSNTAWRCPESTRMFDGCWQLKGAVPYDKSKTDATMANPETGYFTRSNDGGVEAYVAQSADKTTLTFYYDDQRATRTGTTWGIEEMKKDGYDTFPAWAGTYQVADSLTARVVFDASFRDFRPTTTARWFNNYRALKQVEGVEYLNTQNVTDMSRMFINCEGLTSLDLSHFNTQNVTYMGEMFRGCSGLTSLDVKNFNTQNVTSMSAMFSACSGLTSLDLSHLNTQNVTDMSGMFAGSSGLISLDLSRLNTQNVTDMRYMFYGCSALTTIRGNTAWQCPQSEEMFAGCRLLKGAVAYDKYKTDATMANPETGYFTAKPTAVESVRFGADGVQHIYTLQGKRVHGAWKHLPAGVYVVNGKKTVKP